MNDFENDVKSKITPEEYIKLLFKNTDEKGNLFISSLYYTNEDEYSLRCHIDWNEEKTNLAIKEFNDLVFKIKKIASLYQKAGKDLSYIQNLITDQEMNAFYSTYFCPFVYKKANSYEVQDIADKITTIREVNNLRHKMWNKDDITDQEKKLYEDYKDLKLNKVESKTYSEYWSAFYDDCEQRAGRNIGAADYVVRVRRLCKVYEVGAPEPIINNEACMLAASFIIHKYASSMDKVCAEANLAEENLAFVENTYSDDELDYLYRRKKKNNRKHSLNLFLYLILKNKTDYNHHLSQNEILKILHDEFELDVERKALSRAIHDIEDEQIGVSSNPRGGAWYEEEHNLHDSTRRKDT